MNTDIATLPIYIYVGRRANIPSILFNEVVRILWGPIQRVPLTHQWQTAHCPSTESMCAKDAMKRSLLQKYLVKQHTYGTYAPCDI